MLDYSKQILFYGVYRILKILNIIFYTSFLFMSVVGFGFIFAMGVLAYIKRVPWSYPALSMLVWLVGLLGNKAYAKLMENMNPANW